VVWMLVLMFLMVTVFCFIVVYKLIEKIPKINKITASILAILFTCAFVYKWLTNIVSNLFTPMP
jgi:hypothetical protein